VIDGVTLLELMPEMDQEHGCGAAQS